MPTGDDILATFLISSLVKASNRFNGIQRLPCCPRCCDSNGRKMIDPSSRELPSHNHIGFDGPSSLLEIVAGFLHEQANRMNFIP